MKKHIIVTAVFFIFLFGLNIFSAFGQSNANVSYYVKADGNDNNDGLTAENPLRTLHSALEKTKSSDVNTITVIGTLDKDSELIGGFMSFSIGGFIFSLESNKEILITGYQGASGTQRAVLSAINVNAYVVSVKGTDTNIRFEHIEIVNGGGRSNIGGLFIHDGSQVTLGPGAVVRDNAGVGVGISDGSCVIDGGEVQDNLDTGVMVINGSLTLNSGAISNNRSANTGGVSVGPGSRFLMSGGIISGNATTGNAGGVGVAEGGSFNQSGGTITANTASRVGGGVVVLSGGSFNQTGGTIGNNMAAQSPNIFRQPGALGTNR